VYNHNDNTSGRATTPNQFLTTFHFHQPGFFSPEDVLGE
jgi:hypothetical protein